MTPGDKVWFSTREAADDLDLTPAYVADLAARGLIESSQAVPGGRRRFRREWIDAYAEQRPTRQQDSPRRQRPTRRLRSVS